MAKLVKIAILAAGGVALFGGSVFLFSATRSKPHPEAPKQEHPDEPKKPPEGKSPDENAGAETGERPASEGPVEGETANGKTQPSEGGVVGGTPVTSEIGFTLPSPFNETQLSSLLVQLDSARADVDRRTAAADVRDETLDRMRADVDDRREELVRMRDDLVARERELAKKKELFDKEILRLTQAEKKNLKDVASIYEEMAPDAAAERLVALGVSEAAKVLSGLTSKKAAKIIAAMPVDKASEVSSRLGKVLPDEPEPPPAK